MIDNLKGKVDFAIITIREDEYKAVLKRFPIERIYKGTNRSYSIGRVVLADNHYYLVAVVRSIEQGEGHGQDTARDIIEDLDPQWLLLVGIAGGVPAIEFTLGDVVIGSRFTDFSVKAALEGRNMQYAVGGGPMHKQVQDWLALLPAISNELGDWNSKTSIGLDKPPVMLVPSNFYGDEDWRKKVEESLIRHFGPSVPSRLPLFTTGSIASSDTLVKDTQMLRQWQEAARQVLAVEMELGGVYIAARRPEHEYPILAIRGISDVVGFKRHSDWTEYACQSAAAFAYACVMNRPIEPRAANKVNNQVETFTLPKLPKVNFDARYEYEKLVKEIEFFFDRRTPTLEDVGIETIKTKLDDYNINYRFEYKGQLTYFLSFWVEVEYGRYKVGFHDGWTELPDTKGKSYTAMLRLESDVNVVEPIINLQNFSLLNYSPGIQTIKRDELLIGLWDKTIKTIESIVPQIRNVR
jgi:nucleoside phosphorylase